MFNPSRDEARQFFFDAWRKYRQGQILSGLEDLAVRVTLEHPEYHPMLEKPEHYLERDYFPEAGETNPFLHLSLHLAIEEQLAIDQPAGIRTRFRRLAEKAGSRHDALHEVLECLAETLWHARRAGSGPQEALYLECLDQRIARMFT